MPSYRGLAHHASMSLICCSYNASSAAPAFWLSGSNWKESEGRAVDIGGDTCGREKAAILCAAIEKARGCMALGFLTEVARRMLAVAILRIMLADRVIL